ncbi:MAG TPA: PQQ-binding-like beta-propeller repeat protein [Phycisphaerae bacterium]|jgi:outer membrane protein assembly factor BamB
MRTPTGILASVVLAVAGAALLTSLPSCNYFEKHDTEGVIMMGPGKLPGLQEIGLHQVWQRQVSLEPGEQVKNTYRVGQSIYVTTSISRIIRMEADTGILRWSNGLGRENFDIYKPIELKGADNAPTGEVLVVSRGEAFMFNIGTGDQTREPAHLGISVSADPVVVGNTLCVGGADTFYGLYMDRLGMKRWRVPAAGDLFVSAPVALDNNVLVASRSGHLWRISADTGDWDWKDRKTNGIVTAGVAVDFNALYVPCLDQRVYAFRADTGGELWEQQLEGRLENAPALGGPVVMVHTAEGKLWALNRLTGVIAWQMDDVDQIATVGEENVWIGDKSGNIKCIALDSGREVASAPAPGVKLFVRNTLDEKVILVDNTGLVGVYANSKTQSPTP